MVEQAFITGRSEGFSDKQIGCMIRDHMLSLGYDPSTIRRALPPSAKDTTKTRKDYLHREQNVDKHDELDERIMPSYENRSETNENHISYDTIEELKKTIDRLKRELDQERNNAEDQRIQCKNGMFHYTELQNKFNAMHNAPNILIITQDNFPADFGQVFESQDYVFVVEFKGSKVLDISVMSQQQAHNQYMNEKQVTKVL
jgi:uncharacterized protein YdcH (DUF465 family)